VKIRPAGAEFFHADGRTLTNLIVAFRNLRTRPKAKDQKGITN